MMTNVLTTVFCRFGIRSLVIKLNFVPTLSTRLGQEFEVEVQANFRNWSLISIFKQAVKGQSQSPSHPWHIPPLPSTRHAWFFIPFTVVQQKRYLSSTASMINGYHSNYTRLSDVTMGEVCHKQSLRLLWRPVLALVTAMMVIILGFCTKNQELPSKDQWGDMEYQQGT